MSNALTVTQHPPVQIISPNQRPAPDADYRQYFDFAAGRTALFLHTEKLPSSQPWPGGAPKKPEEKTTQIAYMAAVDMFIDFLEGRLPNLAIMDEFVAFLRQPYDGNKVRKSSTINKLLTPVRLFCKFLGKQHAESHNAYHATMGLPRWREYITECATYKGLQSDTTSNLPALWRPDKIRLDEGQVRAVLRSIDRTTIKGKRDYAIMLVAFTTAFRIAEIARITPNSIQFDSGVYLITVIGKRNNIDPVPVDPVVIEALDDYIDTFNADLGPDDPRLITGDIPIWQPLRKGGQKHWNIDEYTRTPAQGISQQTIRDTIANTTAATLGEKFRLAAHDTRRTAAATCYRAGMPINEIQALLRHKDPGTTMRYVGQAPDYKTRTVGNYIDLTS
jgi:integrase